MNEEIRRNEISDDELESVSGGLAVSAEPMPGWEEGVTPAGAIEAD